LSQTENQNRQDNIKKLLVGNLASKSRKQQEGPVEDIWDKTMEEALTRETTMQDLINKVFKKLKDPVLGESQNEQSRKSAITTVIGGVKKLST
jgi:hypothetical protein